MCVNQIKGLYSKINCNRLLIYGTLISLVVFNRIKPNLLVTQVDLGVAVFPLTYSIRNKNMTELRSFLSHAFGSAPLWWNKKKDYGS